MNTDYTGKHKELTEKIKCPVSRDTWISSVGNEKIGNNGGAKRLKVKGQLDVEYLTPLCPLN